MKVVEYMNVSASNTNKLVELVNQKISEGWQPIGGVFAASFVPVTYLQAMVKYA